jgi:hypothetical protein
MSRARESESLTFGCLNTALENVSAHWRATQRAAEHHLGFLPGPADYSLEQREQIAHSNHTRFIAMSVGGRMAAIGIPSIVIGLNEQRAKSVDVWNRTCN